MKAFEWHDADRTVYFGAGRIVEAVALLGGPGYTLMTTRRALEDQSHLGEAAGSLIDVTQGNVDEVARMVLDDGVAGNRLVALGGGRVIDVAKACGAARRSEGQDVTVMAVPTTLSGAEMTWIHRHAAGVDERTPRRRPDVVLNDPDVSASQPEDELAASTLNALGHSVEAPLTPRANPVATSTARQATRQLAAGWSGTEPDREALALGSLLAGAAIDSAWYGLHHVICQALVRGAGLGHGTANAVMLPHSIAALAERFPELMRALDEASGTDTLAFIRRLGDVVGAGTLTELGIDHEILLACSEAAAQRPELDLTAPRASQVEILALYERAR